MIFCLSVSGVQEVSLLVDDDCDQNCLYFLHSEVVRMLKPSSSALTLSHTLMRSYLSHLVKHSLPNISVCNDNTNKPTNGIYFILQFVISIKIIQVTWNTIALIKKNYVSSFIVSNKFQSLNMDCLFVSVGHLVCCCGR